MGPENFSVVMKLIRISNSGRVHPDRFELDRRPLIGLTWTAPYGGELQPELQPRSVGLGSL